MFKSRLGIIMAAALAVFAAQSFGAVTDLIISEVLEGNGGNMKYVEILNRGATTVDLDAQSVALRRYTNGAATVGATILLTGTIAPGARYVAANNQTDINTYYTTSAFTASLTNSNINHNGNDFYDLVYNSSTTPVIIDGFGKDQADGTDPGNVAINVVAYRVNSALPNNGDWGTALPADGAATANGYWTVIYLTAVNANIVGASTPLTGGGASGAEVPVTVSGFSIE